MAEHSLMMPDDSNNYGIDTHQLDHNFVVDDSDPMDHEKTQLQRDDDYHTMSMSASQDMLASEYMDTPAIKLFLVHITSQAIRPKFRPVKILVPKYMLAKKKSVRKKNTSNASVRPKKNVSSLSPTVILFE